MAFATLISCSNDESNEPESGKDFAPEILSFGDVIKYKGVWYPEWDTKPHEDAYLGDYHTLSIKSGNACTQKNSPDMNGTYIYEKIDKNKAILKFTTDYIVTGSKFATYTHDLYLTFSDEKSFTYKGVETQEGFGNKSTGRCEGEGYIIYSNQQASESSTFTHKP